MLQNAPRPICRSFVPGTRDLDLFQPGTRRAFGRDVLGIPESLITFIDGTGGALSQVEFSLPSQCRVLETLVGTLAALGVQILHIQVQAHRDHVQHRLRVAECDGTEVISSRRFEVQHALIALVEAALIGVRRPLTMARQGRLNAAACRTDEEVRERS